MYIRAHDWPQFAEALEARLSAEGLKFGSAEHSNWSVAPGSVILDAAERRQLAEDLRLLWDLYAQCTALYVASLDGHAPAWIHAVAESQLNPIEVRVQRRVARHGLRPRMCCVDYVNLGGSRKIAEVQWHSGGPGLMFGLQAACAEVAPLANGEERLGDPIDRFRALIAGPASARVAAVNDIRPAWMNGERYLQRKYAASNISYHVVDRSRFISEIKERNGEFFHSDAPEPVGFFYFHWIPESSNTAQERLFERLADASLDGATWIESPLDFTYRAKWPLAMPFHSSFRHLFSDELRRILIPSVLLTDCELEVGQILPLLRSASPQAYRLRRLDDFLSLGVSLRRGFVLKCAAGGGQFRSKGKGVFRLTGGRKGVVETLSFVESRMLRAEPWLLQEYVDETFEVPFGCADSFSTKRMHGRFMIYGARTEAGSHDVFGGLANFSRSWKVSGKSTTYDNVDGGGGTAFMDIRLQRDLSAQ